MFQPYGYRVPQVCLDPLLGPNNGQNAFLVTFFYVNALFCLKFAKNCKKIRLRRKKWDPFDQYGPFWANLA